MGVTGEMDTCSVVPCATSSGETGHKKMCCDKTGYGKVDHELSEMKLTDEQLQKVRDRMLERLNQGLKQEKLNESGMSALPTFVTSLPDGTEKGTFLAMDLGGANFRIVKVELPGTPHGRAHVFSQVYKMPEHITKSTAEEFFDHIANCLVDFISHHELQDQRLPLGFTFGFPCSQKGINQSVLLRWTKGFDVSGVVGKDIVTLLREAIKRQTDRGVKFMVDVVALINDTVGTLMSCAYTNKDAVIGMIVGTGTNACYMESTKCVEFLNKTDSLKSHNRICINTEWGSFGEDGSLEDVRTEFDHALDRSSTNFGLMIYEKMIGCLYLGDIVQEILKHLIQDGLLFGGEISEEMKRPFSFPSSFLMQIERERGRRHAVCGQILSNLGYESSTTREREIVKYVCETVSTRAARLCAAGISALIERIRLSQNLDAKARWKLTVAVDGTLYKKHPRFKDTLSSTVNDLSPHCDVAFCISHDGGGKGAALTAAVATRVSTEIDEMDWHLTP